MIIREIIMWLSIMRSNLKDFPEVGSDNKIKAWSEALVIIHKYQKIEQILDDCDLEAWEVLEMIKEVVEDVSENNHHASNS